MTEADWLKGKDADAMLAVVTDRLSSRKWRLLACSMVRRAWDLLPADPFRGAVLWFENQVGREVTAEQTHDWRTQLNEALPKAIEAARNVQRSAVVAADPDTDGREFRENDERRIHPAVALFRGASQCAAAAIQFAGEAVEHAGAAVIGLFNPSDEARLANARMACVQALTAHARSGIQATLALELKSLGDEMADRGQTKNIRIRQSEAIETVSRMTEAAGNRMAEVEEQKQKGDERALARSLQEQLGNPYREYRFEPQWRTDTVVASARAIDQDRAFDRFLILSDALLDADCDEESVLRHCRGTEKHSTEPPPHARGCWVLDIILQTDSELFALPKLTAVQPPKAAERLGLALPRLIDLAMNLDDFDDDEAGPVV